MNKCLLLIGIALCLCVDVVAQVDITAPGDRVQGVPDDTHWPGNEAPPFAIDDNNQTKFLHFKGADQTTGFQVTPASGASVVTGLTLTTANDAEERDPVDYELYGSNASIDGPYTLIASGIIVDFDQDQPWPRYTQNKTPIVIQNNTPFAHYQLLFTAVRNAHRANSMQIAEVEFLATPAGGLPPIVDAGEDRIISWKEMTSTWTQMHPTIYDDDPCNLSATDPDYLVVLWSSLGSQEVDFLGTESEPNVTVVFPAPGVYPLKLQVWDEKGLEGSDTVIVRVTEPDCPLGELPPNPSLIITEIMASNNTTYPTQVNGTQVFSDWIEIYNASEHSIDLSGWSLTDNKNSINKWPLPAVMLEPESYWVVYATGIDFDDDPDNFPYKDDWGRYHTNFQLDLTGEYLALVDPSGSISPGMNVVFPQQTADISYGRCGNQMLFYADPTPGAANRGGGIEVLDRPAYSRSGGTFINPFSLSLSTDRETSEIRYTMDGTLPTKASPLYTSPIVISGSSELLCRAYEPGYTPSPVSSVTFTALATDLKDFNSNLPIVLVETWGQQVIYGTYRKASVAFIEANGGRSHITDPVDYIGASGFKTRGRSTAGAPKKNYGFEIWDSANRDLDMSLLGMPAESDWILYAPYSYDRALINNALIYEVSRRMGRYAVRTRFVEVFVNTNGGKIEIQDYVGLYILMEKIKRDSERVDVEKLDPWEINDTVISGGYMLKIDRPDSGDSGFRTARGNPTYGDGTFCYVTPNEEEITEHQSSWIKTYLNDFEDALYGNDFTDPVTGYAQYVNGASFIDHNLLNMLAMNVDALRLSTHLFKSRNGKLEMGPIWDFDRALNSADGRDDDPERWHGFGDGTDYLGYIWWDRLFEDPAFWQQYIDRWTDLRREPFSDDQINALIDTMAEEIREAQIRNQTRWPGRGPRYGGFDHEISALKDWLFRRTAWIDAQFVEPPIYEPTQGYIDTDQTFRMRESTGLGLIFYTVDGTDPLVLSDMSLGGGISQNAIQYQGETIHFDQMTQVRSRVLSFSKMISPWSGITEAFFTAGPVSANLRLTEIMYHPTSGDTSLGELALEDTQYEYVRFLNVGDFSLDLSGVTITQGISFHFSESHIQNLGAGESVLVVKDRLAFESRYGIDPAYLIAGEYQGKLSNNGEVLCVTEQKEGTIAEFMYHDTWYPDTDGQGSSLMLQNPSRIHLDAWSTKAAWQSSAGIQK